MADDDLNIQQGESLLEALKRKAAELGIDTEPEPIKPGSLGVASGKSGKGKKKAEPKPVSDPSAGLPVETDVYAAFHVYRRLDWNGESETDGQVRSNAARERRMHGPNVLVFQHLHSFGEACLAGCREKVING